MRQDAGTSDSRFWRRVSPDTSRALTTRFLFVLGALFALSAGAQAQYAAATGAPADTASRARGKCWLADVSGGLQWPAAPTARLVLSELARPGTELSLPFAHGPAFRDERAAYAYAPKFTPNTPVFSKHGLPILRDGKFRISYLGQDGVWRAKSLLDGFDQALHRKRLIPAALSAADLDTSFDDLNYFSTNQLVLDDRCGVYTILHEGRDSRIGKAFLMYSPDGGYMWEAFALPLTNPVGTNAVLETPTAGRLLAHPPVITVAPLYHADCSDASKCEAPVQLIDVKRIGASLAIGPLRTVAGRSLAVSLHSGGGNMMVRDGANIYIAYAGSRFPQSASPTTLDSVVKRGTPFYATVYHTDTGQLDPPTYLGRTGAGYVRRNPGDSRSPFVHNGELDDHNQPVMVLDRKGYVHLMLGAHNDTMRYLRSESPHPDSLSRWAIDEAVGDTTTDDQTCAATNCHAFSYPALEVDGDDVVHVVARMPDQYDRYNLVYLQRSPAGWTRFDQPPIAHLPANPAAWFQRLIIPDHELYGVFYHRMSLRPDGTLWVNYSYNFDQFTPGEWREFRARYNIPDVAPYSNCTNVCGYLVNGALPRVSPGLLAYDSRNLWRFATTLDFFTECVGRSHCGPQ